VPPPAEPVTPPSAPAPPAAAPPAPPAAPAPPPAAPAPPPADERMAPDRQRPSTTPRRPPHAEGGSPVSLLSPPQIGQALREPPRVPTPLTQQVAGDGTAELPGGGQRPSEGGGRLPAEAGARPLPDSASRYTVRSGDTLWSIAQRLLGQGHSAEEIGKEVARLWRLNAERIGTADPDLILPGTTLRLR
jgi:nucleoid-associated protein YgaU